MTESTEEARSDSGGTIHRATEPPGEVMPDLASLGDLRRVTLPGELRPAVGPPYFEPGDVLTWHWGSSTDVLRVVRDDERGLVAWLPSGSERLAAEARDGRRLRDRSLAERAALAVSRDYELRLASWTGPGVLRVAPSGRPWSVWYFREDDGSFAGHYVNLELPHERPVDGSRRTHTRDLTLDLWVEGGETWIKDADELEAGAAAGWCTPAQAVVIHQVADLARRELIDGRVWPLDERWEGWQPPAEWDAPLALPRPVES